MVGRQLGQFLRLADAGQVAVLLPVLHLLPHFDAGGGLAAGQSLGVQGLVGAEPVESLLAQSGKFLVIELGGVLALASVGQGRAKGGVVAMTGREIVGELGIGGEGVGVQARSRAIPFLDRAQLRQGESRIMVPSWSSPRMSSATAPLRVGSMT